MSCGGNKKLKPLAKILVSLATNRTDENKYNLKVNTVNSIIKEMAEESQEFTICDHSNMSQSNQIKKNFISKDGVHLTEDGTKMLASNLRKSVEKMLNPTTHFV